MGHFHKLDSGEHISQKKITASGDSITVGFWGYLGFNGTELTVTSNTTGVKPIKGKIIGNSREWTIKGRVSAQAMISALYTDEFGTHTWDWFEVLFGATTSATTDCSSVKAALASGRLILNNPSDVSTFPAICAGRQIDALTGKPVHYAPELIRLLNSLLAGGQVQVMSLYRSTFRDKSGNLRGQGPHGEITGSAVVVRGLDVAGFAGRPVTLKPQAEAINVVANLIRNFATDKYDLGFPRPVGGPTGFAPAEDVFFPVPDLLTARQCFDGKIVRAMNQMLEPAQTQIRAAMGASSGKFGLLFPDGLNHLHVKAY